MAYNNSRYQYGTSPRKIAPDYSPARRKKEITKTVPRKQNTTQKKQMPKAKTKENVDLARKAKLKEEAKMKRKVLAIVLCIFAVLFVISYRSSLISESFAEIKDLKLELEAIEKENQQLSVSIESTLNLNNIEKIAEEKLGMQKLKSDQIVYVNLPKEDYIQPASEEVLIEEDKNFFENIIDKIF